MPGPHDPNHSGSTGLALGEAGEETGTTTSAKEEDTVKASRRLTRFWLGLAAFVLGLATLAIVFFFFPTWPNALVAEAIGAGAALLALCVILLTGGWRAAPVRPDAPADLTAAPEGPAEAAPAAVSMPTDETVATPEPPAAPAIAPTPEPAPEAAIPHAEPPAASSGAAPEAEAAPATEPARPKTGLPPQNGHAAIRRSAPTAPTDDVIAISRPSLTDLPVSYPRPIGGYSLDVEAEDLSQLLGDVAEQTVIVLVTKGKRGIERRERMASKIDAFSQEMAVDPNYAPVVAYLESISALLRAGKPIPATRALVDPFDGLYGYVLALIRRKTGMTHDE